MYPSIDKPISIKINWVSGIEIEFFLIITDVLEYIMVIVLTSAEFHFLDVDHFPVSDAKLVRIVQVVRELRALAVFVVRFEDVEEKTAATDRFCKRETR